MEGLWRRRGSLNHSSSWNDILDIHVFLLRHYPCRRRRRQSLTQRATVWHHYPGAFDSDLRWSDSILPNWLPCLHSGWLKSQSFIRCHPVRVPFKNDLSIRWWQTRTHSFCWCSDFELLLAPLSSVWRHQFDPDDWKWNLPEAVSAYVVPKGGRTERTVD